MTRVITYLDGFNLYFGLRTKGWRRYYWLDPHRLGQRLLPGDHTLVHTHYFTARISASGAKPEKARRQQLYLEAVQTCPDTTLHFGHYLGKVITCRNCKATWTSYEEKMTDVNLAVQLLRDAYADTFDTAVLVSGDSDLFAPIETIRALFPQKRVLVAFPPCRHSKKLESVAHTTFTLGRKVIQDSQFPDQVTKLDGFTLERPGHWK